MHKVKVAPGAVFEVGQGSLVELTADQFAARRNRLEAMATVEARHEGRAVYRVRDNVMFKGGETIAVPAIEKGQEHFVEVLESAAPLTLVPADGMAQSRNDDEHGFNTPKRPASFGRKQR